jgi:hypothetical protein
VYRRRAGNCDDFGEDLVRYILVLILVLITSFSYAQEEKDDPIFMKKFGQKGLEQLAHFKKIEKNALKPYATEEGEYKTAQEIKYDGTTPVISVIPKNDRCKSNGFVSLNSHFNKYFYQADHNSKKYDIQIETIFCSVESLEISKNEFHGQVDGESGSTELVLYKNDKKILDIDLGDDTSDIYVSGQYLLLKVNQGCCDPGHHYYYYDWVNEKVIDENALQIGLADVPPSHVELKDFVLDGGETVCSVLQKYSPQTLKPGDCPPIQQQDDKSKKPVKPDGNK